MTKNSDEAIFERAQNRAKRQWDNFVGEDWEEGGGYENRIGADNSNIQILFNKTAVIGIICGLFK